MCSLKPVKRLTLSPSVWPTDISGLAPCRLPAPTAHVEGSFAATMREAFVENACPWMTAGTSRWTMAHPACPAMTTPFPPPVLSGSSLWGKTQRSGSRKITTSLSAAVAVSAPWLLSPSLVRTVSCSVTTCCCSDLPVLCLWEDCHAWVLEAGIQSPEVS